MRTLGKDLGANFGELDRHVFKHLIDGFDELVGFCARRLGERFKRSALESEPDPETHWSGVQVAIRNTVLVLHGHR